MAAGSSRALWRVSVLTGSKLEPWSLAKLGGATFERSVKCQSGIASTYECSRCLKNLKYHGEQH